MKLKLKCAAGLLAAIALAIGRTSSPAQSTNFVLYNFDTDQVSATPYGTAWGNWFGGYFVSAVWDSTQDANHNPGSGSLLLTLNCNGANQYVLNDGIFPAPNWGPFNIQTIWTNLSFDMRYDLGSAIRTNAAAAGVNGSQGPGSMDFGYMRVGSRNSSFNADWFKYFAIPATNGAGLPNTNWIHINVDLTGVVGSFSDLAGGLINVIIGMDGGAYNNNVMVGPQTIRFDNIAFNGFIAAAPPPTLSIEKATPALRLFGGSGQYGRAQVTLVDTSESWVGGTFPVTYSFTALDNATSPGNLDYHIHIIQNSDNYSGSDYTQSNVLWLQIISGSGNNPACVANLSWKTNAAGTNPNQTASGRTELTITNPVLAGTWTLTFNSETNGTLTAPGASPVPFTLALADTDVITYFSNPVQVRFGIQNNGNTASGGLPHDLAHISVSGTAGAQVNEDFTTEGSNLLDPLVWNLNTSDGAGVVNLVPTNAPYWVRWNLPDTGYALTTATNLGGLWLLPEFYNNYADGLNTLPTQTTQAGIQWNLILPQYLPTVDGTPGGVISPRAFFRLQNPPPSP